MTYEEYRKVKTCIKCKIDLYRGSIVEINGQVKRFGECPKCGSIRREHKIERRD